MTILSLHKQKGDMEFNDFKVLLVDDEPDVLEFMKYNLEKEGFWVYTASNSPSSKNKTTSYCS